jgi:membrane-associated protein
MSIINSFLHVDKQLISLAASYGPIIYIILFCIIFIETGLVVIPFLPGDSLLFAAGAVASQGILSILILLPLLITAAIIGDSVNYFIGKYFGTKLSTSRRINQKYLERTYEFYSKYGGRAIILARFVPIIRTFAPFVAGIGRMNYSKFIAYNIIGGVVWVSLFTLAGYFFGSIPIIKENIVLVTFGIIIISFIPVVIEIIKLKKS